MLQTLRTVQEEKAKLDIKADTLAREKATIESSLKARSEARLLSLSLCIIFLHVPQKRITMHLMTI